MMQPFPSDYNLYRLHTTGGKMTAAEIAELMGLNEDSVRSRISRAQRMLYDAHTETEQSKIIPLHIPDVKPEPPLPDLNSYNDRERWRGQIRDLLTSKDVITVMHPCDRHAPFTDPVSDEMWYALAGLAKPDVVVRGSDEDDLPTISKFAEDGAPEPEIEDFLDLQYQTRRYHTRRTIALLPNALQVNIEGNHGYPRFIRWVNRQAQQSKTTLLRQYIQNVRCDGAVYFIGWKQSVRIGAPLLVMHGKKAGMHAAKATLDMRHSSVSIMAGHTHRPDMYSVVSAQPVTCIISGCLCQIPQNYNDDEDDDYSTWQHSTAIGTIDTQSGLCDLKEVRFHRKERRAWFEYGGKVYIFDAQAIEQKRSDIQEARKAA